MSEMSGNKNLKETSMESYGGGVRDFRVQYHCFRGSKIFFLETNGERW